MAGAQSHSTISDKGMCTWNCYLSIDGAIIIPYRMHRSSITQSCPSICLGRSTCDGGHIFAGRLDEKIRFAGYIFLRLFRLLGGIEVWDEAPQDS